MVFSVGFTLHITSGVLGAESRCCQTGVLKRIKQVYKLTRVTQVCKPVWKLSQNLRGKSIIRGLFVPNQSNRWFAIPFRDMSDMSSLVWTSNGRISDLGLNSLRRR